MPYPFAAAMTFKEFQTRLESEFACVFKQGKELTNHKGESFPISYVERVVNGNKIKRSVDFGAEDEMVNPNVLRSTCSRLEIDITEFNGYHLG